MMMLYRKGSYLSEKVLTDNSSRIYMFNAILENFSEILKNLFLVLMKWSKIHLE